MSEYQNRIFGRENEIEELEYMIKKSKKDKVPEPDGFSHELQQSGRSMDEPRIVLYYKVFFSTDNGSWGSTRSESDGWTSFILEHFEKFKMASKMVAILVFQS